MPRSTAAHRRTRRYSTVRFGRLRSRFTTVWFDRAHLRRGFSKDTSDRTKPAKVAARRAPVIARAGEASSSTGAGERVPARGARSSARRCGRPRGLRSSLQRGQARAAAHSRRRRLLAPEQTPRTGSAMPGHRRRVSTPVLVEGGVPGAGDRARAPARETATQRIRDKRRTPPRSGGQNLSGPPRRHRTSTGSNICSDPERQDARRQE